ncbi:MAG: class I SAM-dependent methyltransferase [Patescibacteria group bacterium]|mgnify:FL=1
MSTLETEETATIAAYNAIAERYADEAEPLHADGFIHHFRAGMPPDPLMLDVGCGFGRSIPIFGDMGIRRFVGIDPAEKLVAIGKRYWPAADFRIIGVYDLSSHFPQEHFDAFWACTTLMHIPRHRMREALDAIRNVIKRGALGFISVPAGEQTFQRWVGNHANEVEPRLTVNQWTLETFRPILAAARLSIIDNLSWQEDGEMLYISVEAR